MKYFHYISKTKVEMLLPQLRRSRFSLRLNPKVEIAGMSVGVDVEKRANSTLVDQLVELIEKMDKKKLIQDVNLSLFIREGSFLRTTSRWRHGLFYFKGGVPKYLNVFPGEKPKEDVFVLTVIYVAWTIVGDSIILLVGSPNNVLGDKTAPDGIFIPGTSGVETAVRRLVNSLRIDEPFAAMGEDYEQVKAIRSNIKIGSRQRYTSEYGKEIMPLPGFMDFLDEAMFHLSLAKIESSFPLSLAQFCLNYLRTLPQANLETVFRVLSKYESTRDNFQLDLEQFSEDFIKSREDYSEEDLRSWTKIWDEIQQAAEQNGLRRISKVCFGSPVYTALL